MGSKNHPFRGRWRLTEMDQWDKEFIDLVGLGFIRFDNQRRGEMRFGAVELNLDYQVAESKEPKLEFSFDCFDEEDAVSGRGWVDLESKALRGRIGFDFGDGSGLSANKMSSMQN